MEQNGTVQYRLVNDFPAYKVGTDGSVWRFYPGRKRRPSPRWKRLSTPLHMNTKKGRPVLNLHSESMHRHVYLGRLILEVFVGPCPEGYQCCHFPDPDPMNCALTNLRWGAPKDNQDDQRKHGTLVGGERHGMARLSNKQVLEIRALKDQITNHAIAQKYGISDGHVSAILKGKARTDSSHAGKGL